MSEIERLIEHFRRFPGIGPRQAKRFVFYLLGRPRTEIVELAKHISELPSLVTVCSLCKRYFSKNGSTSKLCTICADVTRNEEQLLIISTDVDLENVEKSGAYRGKYLVLGGLLPILEKKPESRIRARELLKRIEEQCKNTKLSEVILALSATTEGEHTEEYLRKILTEPATQHGFRITKLGRGLSTGLELEYSDPETIKNALEHRIEDVR